MGGGRVGERGVGDVGWEGGAAEVEGGADGRGEVGVDAEVCAEACEEGCGWELAIDCEGGRLAGLVVGVNVVDMDATTRAYKSKNTTTKRNETR